MPWRPPHSAHATPDHRLDPYRNRAAVVRDGDRVVLTFFAEPDVLNLGLGGHLWWRQWAEPAEFLALLGFDPSGELALDTWLFDDGLTAELADWQRGVFHYHGRSYDLEWLSTEESEALRASWHVD